MIDPKAQKKPGAALIVGVALCAAGARASVIVPPGTTENVPGSPYNTAGGVAPGAVRLADMTGVPVDLIPGGPAGISLSEAVYMEAGGTLDFLFQIVNASNQALSSATLVNYTGSNNLAFGESVGYATVLPTPTGAFILGTAGEPASVTRTGATGSSNTFTFSPSLPAGATSDIFFIQTNARMYDGSGSITVNGARSNVGLVFEPAGTAPIPEPSSFAVIGLLASGTLLVRKRFGLSA